MDNASIWFSCFSNPIISKPPWIFAFSNTRHFASWMRLHYGQNTLPGSAVLRDNVLFLYAVFRFKDILMEWNGLTLLKEVIFCVFLFSIAIFKIISVFIPTRKTGSAPWEDACCKPYSTCARIEIPKETERVCVLSKCCYVWFPNIAISVL